MLDNKIRYMKGGGRCLHYMVRPYPYLRRVLYSDITEVNPIRSHALEPHWWWR